MQIVSTKTGDRLILRKAERSAIDNAAPMLRAIVKHSGGFPEVSASAALAIGDLEALCKALDANAEPKPE